MKAIAPQDINLCALPSVLLAKRKQLPQTAGIYFAIDGDGIVRYIGQSVNLRQRWKSHHCQGYIDDGGRIAYLEVNDTSLLPEIEAALINWFEPPLNQRSLPLAKKVVSVRLLKESYVSFLQIAEEMGKPPTILAREILENFIAEYKNDESDSA